MYTNRLYRSVSLQRRICVGSRAAASDEQDADDRHPDQIRLHERRRA
jgi:hypothetical protein